MCISAMPAASPSATFIKASRLLKILSGRAKQRERGKLEKLCEV
jgi:hypothetical protein